MSPVSRITWQTRGVANFSLISSLSDLITPRSTTGSSRIPCSSVMLTFNEAISVSMSMRLSRVSWPRRISRMSLACNSVNSNGAAINPARAVVWSSLARMRAMIASMTLSALNRPS